MDDNRAALLNDSKEVISKLQTLSVFFDDANLTKIQLRTQLIHKQFEENETLDVNKLELFHVQFTDTIIELLNRIQKQNEQVVNAINDEVHVNTELIDKLNNSISLEEEYPQACKAQADLINGALYNFYQSLSGFTTKPPFPLSINQFNIRFAKDLFYEIGEDIVNEIISFDPDQTYSSDYGIIEKRLLGRQCRMEFKNVFHMGIRAGDTVLEIYKQEKADIYFLFYPTKKTFLSVPLAKLDGLTLTKSTSKKAQTIQDLSDRNFVLSNSIESKKRVIPENVHSILGDYYNKISSMGFLDFMNQIDIQANILKTMLKTDSF